MLTAKPFCVFHDAYLVRFDGGELLVLLDKVADLWELVSAFLSCSFRLCSRLDHCFKVPSVMDSAICGTLTTVSAVSAVSFWWI
jgi:hypothetical protein